MVDPKKLCGASAADRNEAAAAMRAAISGLSESQSETAAAAAAAAADVRADSWQALTRLDCR